MDIPGAAGIVLRDFMRVERQGRVLLCFDGYGREVATGFIEAARDLVESGIVARFIPMCEQHWCVQNGRIRETMGEDISKAQSIVTCLTEADECTRFRVHLLTRAAEDNLRILHMPGVSPEDFVRAVDGVDFRDLQARGKPLRDALTGRNEIEIRTRTVGGEPCVLKARVTARRPHICGGLAESGEIMNLPTGEVYIAPLEDASEGRLVLNGATNGSVFKDKDEVVLFFESGRLDFDRSDFPDRPAAKRTRQRLQETGEKDPVNLTLCEIGIGLNPALKRLVGNEIWDEKAGGTAHIALGANAPFGGAIEGDYHCDMVFYPEAILVDGHALDIPFRRPKNHDKGGRSH